MVRIDRCPVHVPRAKDLTNALGLPEVQREQCTRRPPPHRVHRAPHPHHVVGPTVNAGSAHNQDLRQQEGAPHDRGTVRDAQTLSHYSYSSLQAFHHANISTG